MNPLFLVRRRPQDPFDESLGFDLTAEERARVNCVALHVLAPTSDGAPPRPATVSSALRPAGPAARAPAAAGGGSIAIFFCSRGAWRRAVVARSLAKPGPRRAALRPRLQ